MRWINEIVEQDIKTVNMLGRHDGIPVIDLKCATDGDGLLPDATIRLSITSRRQGTGDPSPHCEACR